MELSQGPQRSFIYSLFLSSCTVPTYLTFHPKRGPCATTNAPPVSYISESVFLLHYILCILTIYVAVIRNETITFITDYISGR